MGQEADEEWTAAANLQPTLPKPDRLLGPPGRLAAYPAFSVSLKKGKPPIPAVSIRCLFP